MRVYGLIFTLFLGLAGIAAPATSREDGDWGIMFYLSSGENSGLYWMTPENPRPEQIVSYTEFESRLLSRTRVSLSPDDQWLAVTSAISASPYYRFMLYERATGAMQTLTSEGPFRKRFFWSPDSKSIAYLMEDWDGKLFTIDRESGDEHLVAAATDLRTRRSGASYFVSLDWSPDGRRIALSFIQESGVSTISDLTIATVNADGSELRRRLDDETWALAPSWYNDSILYYVCRTRAGRLTGLCALDLERSLSLTIRDFSPVLPVTGFIKTLDVGPDGRVVFSYGEASTADAIYLFDLNQRKITNLSELSGYQGSSPRWFFRTSYRT